jgi:hypothetical protein
MSPSRDIHDAKIRFGSIIQVVSLQRNTNGTRLVLRRYRRMNTLIPGCLDAFLPRAYLLKKSIKTHAAWVGMSDSPGGLLPPNRPCSSSSPRGGVSSTARGSTVMHACGAGHGVGLALNRFCELISA